MNEAAAKRLREIEAELDKERMMDPKGPAGAFEDPVPLADRPSVLGEDTGPGWVQSLGEFSTKTAATMSAASAGARAVAPIAARTPTPIGKAAVTAAGAIGAAAMAGYGTEVGLQGVRSALSLPGAPDSVDKAFAAGGEEFWNSAGGEMWGRLLLGGGTTKLSPYRRALSPESAERMKELSARVRSAYEQIGGAKLVDDTRAWWIPGRIMAPRETELTNPAVVRRLQAAGLDPEKAREVAITHGLKPSEVDYGIMSRWWNQLSGTKLKPDEGYERARAELLHVASMNDFGVTFAQSLPPEALGEAVHKAVWGRYDTLNGARKMAMQTLDDKLPEGLKLDMTSFKRSLGIHPPVKMGGVMIRPPSSKAATRHPAYDLAYSLPDQASFSDVENTRTAIATMLRDQRTKKSPSELADIEGLLKQFDDHTAKALPPGYKNDYRKFARADNNRNKDLLDGAFVSGLLQHKPTMRKFADEIIGNTDIDSFRQLEKVVATQPEANRTIASLKSSIAERFMSKAAPNGIIEPNKLLTGLGSQTEGYGKAFIDTVLGPQYSKNYIRFAKTMDEVNTAASKAGQTIRGVSTVAGVAAGVQGLFRGAPGMSGHMAAVIGTALFSPVVLERMLTSPQGAKLLMKTAENVATGRSPMTTARLAGRVLEQAGYAPEDFAKALSPGMALLEPPLQSLRQPGLPGSAKAPFGIRRDPAVPIGQTQAPLRERADYEIGQTLGSSDEGMQ